MSQLIAPYILALLIYQKITSLSQMSRLMQSISHDRLTDLLDSKWDGQTLLDSFILKLLDCFGGYLILDDTVIAKPYSKHLEGFGFIYDHSQRKAVYGIGLVLLVWTNGFIRLPIAFKLYRKGGKKRPDLALDLLSYARNRLKLRRINGVLFDSWYSSRKILKRIRDYGWHFYSQVKSNRHFNGKRVKWNNSGAYWHEIGSLNGGIKVLMIRRYKKFYISSKIDEEWREIYNTYRFRRQTIEETFKILKDQLCLCFLSDRKKHHWDHHIAVELCAFVVLERIRIKYKWTTYKMKEELISRKELYEKEILKIISDVA